ncbi:MAG: hypothetical protein JWN00_1394 [Actinomycetia bacterium]|nr:hypothetical protein [Actinomycetes bacterium]
MTVTVSYRRAMVHHRPHLLRGFAAIGRRESFVSQRTSMGFVLSLIVASLPKVNWPHMVGRMVGWGRGLRTEP